MKLTMPLVVLLLLTIALSAAVVAQSTQSTTYLPAVLKNALAPSPSTTPPTATATVTPTATTPPTITRTPTASPTFTASPTASHTPTASPTSTSSATPTATVTSTPFPPFSTPGPHFPLAYGPYRTGQAPGGATPSPAQIGEDLDILQPETNLIRTYGSCNELAVIPLLAGQRGIYLYQGVWLAKSAAANQQELACYQQRLQENGNLIGGIIGSEVLLRNDLTETQLADLITQAKTLGNVPVSTADTWAEWCNLQTSKPRCPGLTLIRPNVDFVFAHIHPYWEAVPIEHAAAHVVAAQIYLRTTYTDKEVVVGEAGWPTCGTAQGNAQPGVANQRRFITELWRWAKLYNIRVAYFEAFDEPWKTEPNGVGPCWGMYNADRTPKHTNLDWATPTPQATPSTPTVHIDHPPANVTSTTKGNCGVPLFGRVYHAQPGWQVKVEVFTNAWYIQDKWYLNGVAPIIDGQWAMPEAILAGQGSFNNHKIRATVVDATGNPVSNPAVATEVEGIVRSNVCAP